MHAVTTTPAQRLGACFAHFPSRFSLPRNGGRVGLRNDLFEACSAFTRVTACTLARSPEVIRCIEGFSYFVTSITAPIATGWSESCRVGLSHTEKRRLSTAHAITGHSRKNRVCLESSKKVIQISIDHDLSEFSVKRYNATSRPGTSLYWYQTRL